MVFAVTSPRTGHSQQLAYFASDEEVAAADCTAKEARPAATALQTGRLHGRFSPVRLSLDPDAIQRSGPNPLFFIQVGDSASFFLSAGGNASYGGDLVAWDGSWLLCAKSGTAAYRDIDTSKPFLRILPDNQSLNDDGRYERFRVQHFWRATDPKLSVMNPFTGDWVLGTCAGVQATSRC